MYWPAMALTLKPKIGAMVLFIVLYWTNNQQYEQDYKQYEGDYQQYEGTNIQKLTLK